MNLSMSFLIDKIILFYLSAKGDVDGAKLSLSVCLDSDPTFSEAHLLMAQVRN